MQNITLHALIQGACRRILEVQRANGAIPWFEDGPWDPWNHVEGAMALAVGNHLRDAERAYSFLRETQLAGGSWWSEYGNAVPMEDRTHLSRTKAPTIKDTNFTAYVATGIWHHFLATGDTKFLWAHWPMVERAVHFILAMQLPNGSIAWCADGSDLPINEALVSGSSSIYKSLNSAIHIADKLAIEVPLWKIARDRLGHALVHCLHSPGSPWILKSRFSMDWYYPILSGSLSGTPAKQRLAKNWSRFVVKELGCLCVVDEPWVTVAESCELAITLLLQGQRAAAEALFSWQMNLRDEDGAFWMGYQCEEGIVWPEEKPTWTSAAIVLSADALFDISQANGLFKHPDHKSPQRSAAFV